MFIQLSGFPSYSRYTITILWSWHPQDILSTVVLPDSRQRGLTVCCFGPQAIRNIFASIKALLRTSQTNLETQASFTILRPFGIPEFEPNGLADCTVYRTSSRGRMEVKLLLLLEDTRAYSTIKGGITHKSELWVGLTPKFQYASSPRAKLCHAYKCRNAQFSSV